MRIAARSRTGAVGEMPRMAEGSARATSQPDGHRITIRASALTRATNTITYTSTEHSTRHSTALLNQPRLSVTVATDFGNTDDARAAPERAGQQCSSDFNISKNSRRDGPISAQHGPKDDGTLGTTLETKPSGSGPLISDPLSWILVAWTVETRDSRYDQRRAAMPKRGR